jgi:hypothetical protein
MTPARLLAALAAASLLSACGSTVDTAPTGLLVKVAPSSVVADGNTTVTVSVEGDIQYPLALSTTMGHWKYYSADTKTTFLVGPPAVVVLVTCNTATDSSCVTPRTVQVSASDDKHAFGVGNVQFVP